MDMSRKEFIGMAAAFAGGAASESSDVFDLERQADPPPVDTGEPYDLLGTRMVFTNWFYVRPGSFGWYDAQGRNVTVAGSEGPFGATMRRVDHPHGIRLRAESARRRGPVIAPERPWEQGGRGLAFGCVLMDGGRLRAWGGCPAGPCVWESADGVAWTRPKLGVKEHEGSRETNLLDAGVGAVFVDPSAPDQERYKSVTLGDINVEQYAAFRARHPGRWQPRAYRKDVGHVYALRGHVSPDGIRWRTLPEPLCLEHSDTQIVAYRDVRLGKYVIYTRSYMIGPRSPRAQGENIVWWGGDAGGPGRRSIGRTESSDFAAFHVSDVIVVPGPDLRADDVLYTNCRTCIPQAPDQHLMFPAVWHTYDDTTTVVLASSHDGRVWQFVPGSSVLDTAPFGEWDGGCVFAQPDLVELPNGDFALPYTGYDVPHKYPRGQYRYAPGLAVWPKGRIVALEAEQSGEFATVGIIPPKSRLLVNAVTKRGGSLLIEAAGMTGKPLPGRAFADAVPILGDRFRHPVTWKDGDRLPTDAGVILRFRMDQVKLYGLDFV
ncbi:MAG: hypothetical protein GX446_09110 [Chthonomonadales bacterium]|nr:hypothetical protein [Chthonomonadales bacterium]